MRISIWFHMDLYLLCQIGATRAMSGKVGGKIILKKCTKCQLELTIDNFYPSKITKDGYRYQCKSCELIQKRQWKKTPRGKFHRYKYKHSINGKAARKRYLKKHPEIKRREWRRCRAVRRSLGFKPINIPFENSVAHHLDDTYVMYIPESIHIKYNGYDRELHRFLVLNELYIQNIIL